MNPKHVTDRRPVSRRAALQALATTVGVGAAAPLTASDVTAHLHPAPEASLAPQAAAAPPATFLSAHQLATLQVLSALILPGSEASGTPAFLDKLVAVESVDARRLFVSALGAFDGAAMRAHGRAFKDITAAEQNAILVQASTTAPAPQVVAAGDPTAGVRIEPSNLRDYFDHLKGRIADIHFSSEAGMRELGWTGTMLFTRFNGCATQP